MNGLRVDSKSRMRRLAGGEFWMGCERFYPEEGPVRKVRVAPFLMDETPVTNADFAAFVADTGYLTLAERGLDGALREMPGVRVPGSMVFNNEYQSDGNAPRTWWHFVPGACWRHPLGPGSDLVGLDHHPVVHVAFEDAAAYAAWAGKELPTEAEWEYAARGGLDAADYAWGDELEPGGQYMANTWQGPFPSRNLALDGWERTSPVGSFPANGFGLYDMIGNVWEWTVDRWLLPGASPDPAKPTCCARKAGLAGAGTSHYAEGQGQVISLVIKGGSYLCAPNYCRRYRPAARHPQAVDIPTGHIGFRCIVRE